jgi:hypothetical protein
VHLVQLVVPRAPDEGLVKGVVRVEEDMHLVVARRARHQLAELPEVGHLDVAHQRHGEPHSERLERLAHLVRVEELLTRQLRHHGAAPRRDRDEAL